MKTSLPSHETRVTAPANEEAAKLGSRTQPLYQRVAQAILGDIKSGRYKPGDRLPTENDLMRNHGVSRITARQAFEVLRQQGLIERFPNRGSFVTAARIGTWRLNSIEDIVRLGAETQTKVLEWKLVQMPAAIRALLDAKESEVFRLRGVRHRDSEPIYFIEAHMLKRLGAQIQRSDLIHHTPIDLLTKALGIRVVRAVEEIAAGALDSAHARHLKIAPGSPVLLQDLRHFDDHDHALLLVRCWWRAEQFKRRYEITRAL